MSTNTTINLWNGQINSPYDHQNHKLSNITDPDDLKVGQWATWCCHQDLEQIDANLLEQIREDFINPDPWPIWKVWNTRKEALEDILIGWSENSDEYREIIEMLQEEESVL